ncbi:MAG: hypothetical protein KCHDKBKB_02135 [Elusimicrobia bacterium]|nr:hypothetical protein [Elusimicrobiota bacterium]
MVASHWPLVVPIVALPLVLVNVPPYMVNIPLTSIVVVDPTNSPPDCVYPPTVSVLVHWLNTPFMMVMVLETVKFLLR